jgi:phospholipid/cholesterol/gamma-HCH transport system substrate-binding protein
MTLQRQRLERARRTDPIAGALALLVALAGTYWAFARPQPFRERFELKAVVTSVNGVKPTFTPVRIAGVEVGEVAAVKSFRGTHTSLVTMELEDSALPVHSDARVKVRPRLFLEGNSFIDLSPGTPGAPVAREGATIPLERTSVMVTLPHVLGALTADTRENLQELLHSYGQSVNRQPTAAEDATQDPSVHRTTGGQALNGALRHAARAMPTSAVVADAWTGRSRGDLRRAVAGFAEVAQGLDDAGPQLGEMLSGIRRASAAFARESASVTATLGELPGALRDTSTALHELRAAMPPAKALAAATTAALPAVPAALESGVPWLRQLQPLLGPRELGADLDSLLPATRQLAPGVRPTGDLLRELDLLSRCGSKVLIPTANAKIADGPRSAGTSTFAEFLSAVVGANGAAQNYDGNGFMLRGHPGGGDASIATAKTRWMGEPAYGNAVAPPQGTRPAKPQALPPHRPDVACHRNAAPDLNGPAAAPGPADGSGR